MRRIAIGAAGVLCALGLACSAWAAETDNFTHREGYRNLPDASDTVSRYVNNAIQAALQAYQRGASRTNATNRCDNDGLLTYLQVTLDTNEPRVTGRIHRTPLAKLPRGAPGTNGSKEPIEGSIYDVGKYLLYTSGYVMMAKRACCSPVLNLDGHLAGTDKISHFLGHGFALFRRYNEPDGNLEEALKLSVARENGPWGLSGTGVRSYGDMAANYAGLRFWQRMFGGSAPYIECRDGEFRQTNAFNIRDYVDDSWDEGINCSDFANPEFTLAVNTRIMQATDGKTCPLEPRSCAELVAKYPTLVARYILHPHCRRAAASEDPLPVNDCRYGLGGDNKLPKPSSSGKSSLIDWIRDKIRGSRAKGNAEELRK